MQLWEHCFHHVVQSLPLQMQLHVIFRLLDHELSLISHSEQISGEITASLIVGLPSDVSAGRSYP